jgi:hypothetical protein
MDESTPFLTNPSPTTMELPVSDSRVVNLTYKLSLNGTSTLDALLDDWWSQMRASLLKRLTQNSKNQGFSLTIQETQLWSMDTEAELWISTIERPKSSD